ncbi:bifunctional 3-(3-hydroxy-phenyl)propionate/3-hydroxycinnamic acid hydroxylase [Maricurvus nonylphenolicus]|uniref:bifunctional 3-(3-hydroxy-phenyl)propionate/3-hydroxycinnamic acid hydroxylase MhpA n=1 Tax=Maricurvus nonylphenolicus TaxID=1008307 RepID=UPI0036F21F89
MLEYTTSVVIAGAGPAGLTLAHLLDSHGIDSIVLEKLDKTIEEPRAIGIDSESLRTHQAANTLEDIAGEIYSEIDATQYLNADGKLLFEFDTLGLRPYGHEFFNTFDQAAFDRILANELPKREHARLWFNHELTGYQQDEEGITIEALNADKQPIVIKAQFLVGCDGGRSVIRQLIGATMTGDSNEFPWLVIDTVDPGYDSGPSSRFFCDPARPGMTIKKHHKQRRWEWMLMPGEEPEALLDDDMINSLIAPFTDPAQVDVFRKRVYNFSAIIADRWQDGRVFIAGDAAHMTPPFAGQGLNSGMRDVRNLSWKLAMVIKGKADRALLDTYQQERWQHAKDLIQFALDLGEQIQPIDPQKAAERDAFFFELQKDPAGAEAFAEGMAQSILARAIDSGIVIPNPECAVTGQLLPQPEVTCADGNTLLLDELLGKEFSILGYNCDPEAEIDADTLATWKALGANFVAVSDHENDNGWPVTCDAGLTEFFAGSSNKLVLLRPDKFCLASFNPENASTILPKAETLLQLR